jgi:hypothetical protein
MSTINKATIIAMLRTWIRQRPGLEFGNYGQIAPYRAELRQIAKDKRDAETLLRAVEWRDSITAEDLLAAFPRAFSGRLRLEQRDDGKWALDYCTGQYWPTEYRKAAAAVLASVLWDRARADMPAPSGKVKRTSGVGPFAHESEHDSIEGLSPGDWLRRHFRREFGRSIQSRWFD